MNFDFGKFASVGTEVESAFGETKPEEVLASMANEIQSINTEENQEEKKEDLVSLSDEQVKKNLEFLKAQKEKSNNKEDLKNVEDKEKPKEEPKNKDKNTKAAKVKSTPQKKEEPIVYSRPRNVIAYGELVYTEEDVNASLDDIRNTLVEQYGYSEFKDKDKCEMRFDAKTGEVYPHIQFNKKG